MKAVIERVGKERRRLSLFKDEIHTNCLVPVEDRKFDAFKYVQGQLLARGEIQCIGATTWTSTRQLHRKRHGAERRFQK